MFFFCLFLSLQIGFFLGLLVGNRRSKRRPSPRVAKISFIVGGQQVYEMQLQDNKSLPISISGQDVKGNAAPLNPKAQPSWSVDNPALATIVAAADGLSAVVTPVGPLGSFNVQVAIPAVDSEAAMNGSLPVEIVASEATQIALTAGTPQ